MMVNESRLLGIERLLEAQRYEIEALRRKVTEQGQLLAKAWSGGGGNGGGGGFFVGVATSAITARSGSTLGSGTVEIYATSSGTMTATGTTRTVYNLDTAISIGKRVAVQPDATGTLIAAPLECE